MTPDERERVLDLEGIRRRCEAANDYESLAERFYADTGMMAPGKDAPAALGGPDPKERQAEWNRWLSYETRRRLDAAEHDRAALLAEIDRLHASTEAQ